MVCAEDPLPNMTDPNVRPCSEDHNGVFATLTKDTEGSIVVDGLPVGEDLAWSPGSGAAGKLPHLDLDSATGGMITSVPLRYGHHQVRVRWISGWMFLVTVVPSGMIVSTGAL